MAIHPQTILKVIDNSGAAYLKCIKTLRKRKAPGVVGDMIVGSVKHTKALEDTKANSKVTRVGRGEVVKAIIVRTRSQVTENGCTTRFDDNACVLVDVDPKKNTIIPKGTRITSAVSQELRNKGMTKILSLATTVA